MHDNLVISLLHKQLTDQLESADRQLLLDWLANSSKNVDVQNEVSQVWDMSKNYRPSFTPDVDKGFERFSQRIKAEDEESIIKEPPNKAPLKLSFVKKWMKYAAAVVILLGCFAIWQLTQNAIVNQQLVSTIDDEIKNLQLIDGSSVWLNEKSTLQFPDKFRGENRIVNLEGEGYFEIASNKKQPFIIKGGEADIKVIGTAFNFNTDIGKGIMEIEVKEGIVELTPVGSSESLFLTKNEKGFYDSVNKKILPKEILKISNADYFVTKKYSFVNSKYSFVFEILQKVYNVNFEFSDPNLSECLLTSPIEFNNQNLNATIEILESVYEHKNLSIEPIGKETYLIKADACN